MYTLPKCYCGNDVKFINYKSGYNQYCSYKCRSNSPENQEKRKQTCLKKYGVEHPLQSQEIQEKSKQTCLKKHGVEYPAQSQKYKDTLMKNYGVEHNMHSSELFNKNQKSRFKFKTHRGFRCQGYEPKAIDFLIDVLNINPENITTSNIDIGSFTYFYDNKKHKYYPDIKIKSNNLLIEVKSTYTWKQGYDRNLAKMKATNALLMIFDQESNIPKIYISEYPDENLN